MMTNCREVRKNRESLVLVFNSYLINTFLFNLIIEQGMLVITEATTDCHENDEKER